MTITAKWNCDREHRFSMLVALWAVTFVCTLEAGISRAAGTREAARRVREGIAQQKAGNFEAAEQAFAEAAKSLPDDARVTYDRACALVAQGKLDEGEKLFLQSRLAREPRLVAASDYNLGCLAVARAKTKLGDRPDDAAPEVRQEVVELVKKAVSYYRDCLHTEPAHGSARHNLEVLRLWTKHMEDLWSQRDREKRREALGLLEFLEMIQSDQEMLRLGSQGLAREIDSPRRRQATTRSSQAQRELAEEIEPLREKIRGLVSESPSASSPQPAKPDPQLAAAVESLLDVAGKAQGEMSRAAIDLRTNQPLSANGAQARAIDHLDQIYRTIAPFEHVLQKAIRRQEGLVELSQTATAVPPSGNGASGDTDEAARGQRHVAGWAEVLGPKADLQLEKGKAEEGKEVAPPAGVAPDPAPGTTPAARAASALKEGLQKAIELGPRAHSAATQAAADLAKDNWTSALPKQEEALKLLKEIAAAIPPPPSPPKQPPENQDKSEEKEPPAQDKGDKQQEKNPVDENAKDKSQEKQQKAQRPEPSLQQAEALLRQVQERERDYKEKQKKIQALIRGAAKVDKDW